MFSPPIYLVRHAEAAQAVDDGQRPLTPAGRAAVERLAQWCAGKGFVPHRIRHSGVLRAAQTAEILAARLSPPAGVRAVRGLAPDDDPQRWYDELPHETESEMLVTHMPFVADLTSLLITGSAGRFVLAYSPATLARIEQRSGGYRVTASWSP